jgi:hypothetical protein
MSDNNLPNTLKSFEDIIKELDKLEDNNTFQEGKQLIIKEIQKNCHNEQFLESLIKGVEKIINEGNIRLQVLKNMKEKIKQQKK